MRNKNAVLIFEDCECLLEDRGTTSNTMISSLLNLTDGILADSINLKIICTFNADLSSIDKALLRKGRLKIKYEFKKLTKDKAISIAKEKGLPIPHSDITVADLYNPDDNYSEYKTHKRIGF